MQSLLHSERTWRDARLRPLQFGATQMTKLSLNEETPTCGPKGGWHVGFPRCSVSTLLDTYSWTRRPGEKEILYLCYCCNLSTGWLKIGDAVTQNSSLNKIQIYEKCSQTMRPAQRNFWPPWHNKSAARSRRNEEISYEGQRSHEGIVRFKGGGRTMEVINF